jgi:hypothetical protein
MELAMRVFSQAVRRVTMAAGSFVLLGAAVLAAATPAAATPAGRNPNPQCGQDAPGVLLVVLVRTSPPKNWGFEATGPYNLAARGINGPINKLVNYSICRVWLHQHSDPNSPGWSVCFNPREDGGPSYLVARKYTHAGSMVISGNFSKCP